MELISLPDCEKVHSKLTVGKQYTIIREVGVNGVLIELDDGSDTIIILKSRFA